MDLPESDRWGKLIYSEVHDAEIRSIYYDKAQGNLRLDLECVTKEGSRFGYLLFEGCSQFRATEFIMQNVISGLYQFSSREISKGFAVEHLIFALTEDDYIPKADSENVKRLMDEIISENSYLFYIMPSRGAEIVVICKAINFVKNS